MICECYREEKNFFGKVGTCWGTAERDACACGGDKSKCDFYPSVREAEKKPITNYDRIVSKSPEELAEWIGKVTAGGYGMCAPGHYDCTGKDSCAPCWLDWLKEEVNE